MTLDIFMAGTYLLIKSTQYSEEFKEEQKIEMKFERFDLPLIKCFWPII